MVIEKLTTRIISNNEIQQIKISTISINNINKVEFIIEKVRGKTKKTYLETFVLTFNESMFLKDILIEFEKKIKGI